MGEEKRRKLPKILVLVLTAIIPPGLIAALAHTRVSAHPIAATLILIAYELFLAILGFIADIFGELRKRWVIRLANALDSSIQRTISRYTREYLKYMRASNSYVDLKGLTTRGDYTLSLDEVFVSLSLDSNTLHTLTPDPVSYRPEKADGDPRRIWYWLNTAHAGKVPLAIIGPPGSGKTTLLKHIAFVLSSRARPAFGRSIPWKLPVIISLRDHRGKFSGKPPSLAQLIRSSISELSDREPPDWIETQLRHNRFLIMLDGLDEIAESEVRQSLADWTDRQRNLYPDALFIVTSRPFGYRDNPLEAAIVLQVQPFSQDQIEAFLDRWYLATSIRSHGKDNLAARLTARSGYQNLLQKLNDTPELLELGINPLLLTMIANVHYYRGALPGSRAELYKEVCEVFLGKRHQSRGVVIDMPTLQKQAVLQALAYSMMCRHTRDMSLQGASEDISGVLANVAPGMTVEDFLRRLEESSGLLIERERGVYSFAHQTFQEYLASTHIRDRGLVDELVKHTGDSWWRETIRLYVAQADGTPIIAQCLSESSYDPYALSLAVECTEEGREVSAETRAQLAELISPANARFDAAARKTAALVRLLRRANAYTRISRNGFISSRPVTCLEYQLFLDERWDGERRTPDSWTEEVYPEGTDDEPIVGIRYSDAISFCEWLQKTLADQWTYRLPRSTDVISPDSNATFLSVMQGPAQALWVTTPASFERMKELTHIINRRSFADLLSFLTEPITRSMRYSITYDVASEGRSYAAEAFSPPHDILGAQVESDVGEAKTRLSSAQAPGLNRNEDACDADLDAVKCIVTSDHAGFWSPDQSDERSGSQMLKMAWKNINGLDIGRLTATIETVARRSDTAPSAARATAAADLISQLQAQASKLAESSSVAFNRATAPSNRPGFAEERLIARFCAMSCIWICITLNDGLGGSASGAALNRSGFLKRVLGGAGKRAKEKRDPDDMDSFADDAAKFAKIYAQLVAFEARMDRRLPAWEGLAYLRSSTEAVEDDMEVLANQLRRSRSSKSILARLGVGVEPQVSWHIIRRGDAEEEAIVTVRLVSARGRRRPDIIDLP